MNRSVSTGSKIKALEKKIKILEKSSENTESDLLRLNHELSLALSTTISLTRTLDLLLDVCCRVDGIDGGAIYLTDRLTGGLRLVSHYSMHTQALKSMAVFDFAAPETRLVMKGKPVYFSSENYKGDIFECKFMEKNGSKFFAIIPVNYDNRIVASINLYSFRMNSISLNSRLTIEAFAMRAGAIIARVNAVLALQESEEKYRSLLETMNEGFIILDEDFLITYGNNRICEMLGYRYDEVLGLPITYFFDETNKKLLHNQMSRRKRGGQKSYEITWIKADGNIIETIVAPKAILNKYGQFKGSFAVITDISKLKETSKILEKKERDLIEKTNILQEVNIALRVLLKKRDEDKKELEEKVLLNVKQLINPIIEKIKKSGLDQKQKALFDIIESNLSDIISPYTRSLFSKHLELTPTEFDISNFIREGKTTKDISEIMNLSNRTIETHRFRIRKKFGLNNKRVSLRTYLLSLQ